MKMNVGQIIAKALKAYGVPYITGLPGHGNWNLLDAFNDQGYDVPVVQVMHEQAAAQREMRWLADMAAKAGAEQCQACGERITSRQGSVTAPEDHLLLPGFGPPRFHTRHACREGLDSYDRDRRRVLGDAWTPLIPDETPLPLTERHTA